MRKTKLNAAQLRGRLYAVPQRCLDLPLTPCLTLLLPSGFLRVPDYCQHGAPSVIAWNMRSRPHAQGAACTVIS